jgi:hypothetical protein
MVKIANFTSVLEIAFGLNALFYYFELLPHSEKQITKLMERNEELAKEKVAVTKNAYAYPIAFVAGCFHYAIKSVFSKLSVAVSVMLLILLLRSSFNPDAQLSTFLIWVVLGFAYGVPLTTLHLHSRNVKLVQAANRALEIEIIRAREESHGFQALEHGAIATPANAET